MGPESEQTFSGLLTRTRESLLSLLGVLMGSLEEVHPVVTFIPSGSRALCFARWSQEEMLLGE